MHTPTIQLTKFHTRLLLGLLLPIWLFIASCGSNDEVRLIGTNFKDDIQEQQNLVFQFDKNLYPDSLLNRWDSTEYITFEPKVHGSFKWNHANELVFSPQNGFEPGLAYKAKLTNNITAKAANKGLKVDNAKVFTFQTAPLRVKNVHAFWTKGYQNSNVMLQVDVVFNYDTDVTQAASKIRMSNLGNAVSYNVINSGIGNKVSMQFVPMNVGKKDVMLTIAVDKGIGIAKSKVASKNDTTFTTAVASRYQLKVVDNQAQHDGSMGIVNIALSQPVMEQGLKSAITIEPAVNFEVNVTDGGLVISSADFNPEKTYNISMSNALKGAFGGTFEEERTIQAYFGTLAPALNFINEKGMYLSTKGYRNLALNIVQIPEVKVTVIKVYENNILQLFREGQSWAYDYNEEEDEYSEYRYYNTRNLGDTVYSELIDVAKLPKHHAAHLLHLDFADKLKSNDGVFIVVIGSTAHQWIQTSKILSLSDIGLIVKQEKGRLLVFANSIRNATPIANAKVSFISTTNQNVHTAQTDKDGVAVFDKLQQSIPGRTIGLVSASHKDEYSFLTFQQARVETSRYDVGGRMINDAGLNTWIYAERNLYRPGETIHVSAVLRTESWMPPGEMPIKFRLMMPNGKEFSSKKKILNVQGSAEVAFEVPPTALTGTYVLEVLSGNEVLLNTYNFSIEDFMPDRIKADLQLNNAVFKIGEPVIGTIQANNLFGTPAANRNYEWELNISKRDFEPKGYEAYNFTVSKQFDFSSIFRSGVTDAHGAAIERVTLDTNLTETGLLKGHIRTSVFDETGRPVHRYANVDIFTQHTFVGIKLLNSYVATRVPLSIGLVALNKDGKPQSQRVEVKMVRKEWQNVIEETHKRYKYVSKWVEKDLGSQQLTINNNTVFNFTPDQSGEYEVRVYIEGSKSYVSQTFYAYGMGGAAQTSFEVNNEGNVTIKADKERYEPGETINLLFTTPFEGRMLVTVERDKVLEYHFVNTNNRAASLKLKASDAYLPNVYIATTLFRAMDGSDMPLTVAHGYRNIPVSATKNALPLSLSMVPHSRSKTTQVVQIKTAPNAYVTVAAVDEGILQVKNYKTPDPYSFFYQKVALTCNSFDVYPLLLPEYKMTSSSTGGDGAASDMDGRVNPMFVNRVKNVSFWSGIVQADANGHLKYEIAVPQFSGAIRVMAVAYKDKAFGSKDNTMKVADPIVISTALPRFLSPDDQATMPITLSNTTAKEATAIVSVSTQGAVNITKSFQQNVSIKPNGEARVVFDIAAAQEIGVGKVLVTVKALGETFTEETELSVRPPASLQKVYLVGTVVAGKPVNIDLQHNFLPKTVKGSLVIANTPLVKFSKNLSNLVNYPHGCIEQTISAAFPQMYFADLSRVVNSSEGREVNANYNVQQAIYKIQASQLYNGAMSYWPGGSYESWWGSVYAAHFLLEAQKAGFEVNTTTYNRLLDYLRFRLKKKEVIAYHYNNNQRKTIAAKEIPYTLYVLALARKAEVSVMNYYKGNLESLSMDGKYLLAAAYALNGQQDKAKQILPKSFVGEESVTQFGGSFYSFVRDKAIALNTLLDVNPQDPQVAILARQVSEDLANAPYLNTQENAFGILALGKLAREAAATSGEIVVNVGGKKVASTEGAPLQIDVQSYFPQSVQLSASGKGSFYYFRELSGVSATGDVPAADKFMKVRRYYYTRNGQLINNNTFKQNDLIIVKITIEGQYTNSIDNVVITDMLPAGLEIENTRLNEIPNLKWVNDVKERDEPDYLDVRDDRINIFTSVSSKPKSFYYMVRAVSPGVYKLGHVQADAMYNGAYHSYNGAGIVRVGL